MFEYEQQAIDQCIKSVCDRLQLPATELRWSWIPFSGHWGISTSFFSTAASEAKAKGEKTNVGARAQEIAQQVSQEIDLPGGFERVEAVRGYLNLYFTPAIYSRKVVDSVLESKDRFGWGNPRNQRVMVEFSQPNTHKAFHVGHLRNVILGHCVCNLLEAAGNEVIRANYPGDIGLHVMKWLWNYQKFHAGEAPGEEKIRWMGDIYAEADLRFQSPENEAEVRELFSRWDRGDPEVVSLWKRTREWSMEAFDQIYQLMGVHFDHIYFESEMEEAGKELVKKIIEQGIARDERPEGAVIIPLDELLGLEEKFRVLVILRSDGTSLYSTKDLPLAIKKFEDYKLDRSIYVIDVRQSLYMQQIFKTLELMGYEWASQCHHLAYEIVNLPGNVTMSSRDGTVVLLEDLIREATQRAMDIVEKKNPELEKSKQEDIARAVALGAIKYPMLARENTKIVTFDWDAALDFNGQAAPYIQYAYVRAGSILRKAGRELPDGMLPEYELTPVEVELIEMISRLPREIERAAEEYRPLYIANLSYDIARVFNDFYNRCPVLTADQPVRDFRLRMVAAARQAIHNALFLMGISAPEMM
jgi:arginyl-tRNA synthetase